MSAPVDDRIVSMKFDNNAFERGVQTTLGSLAKLRESLKFNNAGKGLSEVGDQAKRINLNPLANAADHVRLRFNAMQIAFATVVSTITRQALYAGERIIKSFTVGPIIEGWQNYQLQIKATQTILANTAASGAKLSDVNRVLKDMNDYANLTVYNFAEMAKNIGTFTAAGVDLKTSEESIKGIANLAAFSGSTSEQASSAMYQLSQAIAAGTVHLQDWNSVVNAGIGGATFQKALAQTAEHMGTLQKGAVAITGPMKQLTISGNSFRESLQAKSTKGWLTSDVLTTTLKQLSGDMSEAQLRAQGYTAAQAKAIYDLGQTALHSATQMKTFSQFWETITSTAASGWADTFKAVVGDLPQATSLYTNLGNAITGWITNSAKARNDLLQGWSDKGGRATLLAAFTDAAKNLGAILKPIREGFREIFPRETVDNLLALTNRFKAFVDSFKIGAKTSDELKRTFAGLFAIVHIGIEAISGLVHGLLSLGGAVGKSSGGLLAFTAKIGDYLVALDKAISKGQFFQKLFEGIANVLSVPIALLGALRDMLLSLFDGFQKSDASNFSKRLDSVGGAASAAEKSLGRVGEVIHRIGQALAPLGNAIKVVFGGLGKAIASAFSGGNFNQALDALNTGFFGALILILRKFAKDGLSLHIGGKSGVFGSVKETFEQLTGTLKAMQTQIRAKAILEIAAAIGILSLSAVALAGVDSGKLTKAMVALAVGFAELVVAMKALNQMTGIIGTGKMVAMSAALVVLSGAILGLTASVVVLSLLSWEKLSRGLAGVAALLTLVSAASIPLSRNSKGMIAAGVGIAAMAAGIIEMSTAVALLGSMKMETIGKGLLGVGAALVVVAGAMKIMPKGMLAQAAALLAIGVAINELGVALQVMGHMGIETIGKGLGTLAASLLVMAGAMKIMQSNIGGAVTVGILSASLLGLATAMELLGHMNILTIAKSLGVMAVSLGVLIGAGYLAEGAIPGILALGAGMVLLGGGLGLVSLACLGFATAFGVLVAGIGAGVGIIIGAFHGVINILKELPKDFVEMLTNVATAVTNGVDLIAKAFGRVIGDFLSIITRLAPKAATAFIAVIRAMSRAVIASAGLIATAATSTVATFLNNIAKGLGKIIQAGTNIVLAVLKGIAKSTKQIVDGVGQMLLSILQSIDGAITKYGPQLRNEGLKIAGHIIDGMTGGLASKGISIAKSGLGAAKNFLGGIASTGKGILGGLGIGSPSREMIKAMGFIADGFEVGVQKHGGRIAATGNKSAQAFVGALKTSLAHVPELDNINPTITPVLDLSQVAKDAKQISGYLSVNPIDSTLSFNQADTISTDRQRAALTSTDVQPPKGDVSITVEQTNNSPQALSPIDVYRSTVSAVALAKEALGA